jgi:hypothetical protein
VSLGFKKREVLFAYFVSLHVVSQALSGRNFR